MEKEVENRINQIENALKEQEHRTLKIVSNLLKYGFDDSDIERRKAVWKALFGFIIKQSRITLVIAVTSGIIAIVSLYLAWKSNKIVEAQNELIVQQNERMEQQTYLQEAERRSSYIFLMSNIFEQINAELKEDYLKNEIRDLSPQLIGGIAALSQRLKPYRLLEGDTLSNKLSPERGQLLAMLVRSELADTTYKQIFYNSDFSYADLRDIPFVRANLNGAHLEYANFHGSNLYKADLSNSALSNAIFCYSTIIGTKFKNANLFYANMENAFVSPNWLKSLVKMNTEALKILHEKKVLENPYKSHVGISVSQILEKYEIGDVYKEAYQLGDEIFERRKLIKKKKKPEPNNNG